ncbi:MAG: TIM barrel protein [Boseongicola sp. SB0677_bin_26]|nr:TIM barrel protein [Boseongicola sp. SB0665_bin_10]MYG26888.1 TIM barrel protein [Boseongicola sp. SB0677_bin_26]
MPAVQLNRQRYAARLNAFKAALPPDRHDVPHLIELVARVGNLDAADLNFPDHVSAANESAVRVALETSGVRLNGLAMRYYGDPDFAIGAYTNPDPAIRRKAIDQTREAIDICARLGARQLTLWMGQDGFDYAFQLDYARAWDDTVSAMAEAADHNREIDIAIEYKPNDPRAYSLMPDVGTALLATRELDRPNVGVTLDFAHVLHADEMPAYAASLVARHSRLLGVHLNDGYGKRDDGLMVGTVHPVATVELFVELNRIGYDGVIYFDTFPDLTGLDPVEEVRTNVHMAERLSLVADKLRADRDLAAAIARQDAALSQRIVARALYGE